MRILLGAFALLVGAAPAWSQAPRTNARAVHVSGPSAAVSGAQIDVDIEIAVEFRDADAFAFEVPEGAEQIGPDDLLELDELPPSAAAGDQQ